MPEPDSPDLPGHLAPLILIADDNAPLRELCRAALEFERYQVLTAANGREALALAERWRPEALVTDVAMPGLDGFGLIRAVRRLYPGLPAIVMSGRLDADVGFVAEDLAAEHGAVVTLMKPFSLSLLQEALRAVVAPRAPVLPAARRSSSNLKRRSPRRAPTRAARSRRVAAAADNGGPSEAPRRAPPRGAAAGPPPPAAR
jgi:two-component system chemotaxis response regulator CheB